MGNQETISVWGPNLPHDHSIATSYNKTFDPPNWIEFAKDILVSYVWGYFQLWKSPLPLNPTIILQDIPNEKKVKDVNM